MTSYITMTSGARTRVLRTRGDEPAQTVTSLADPHEAARLAHALTTFGTDLPWHVTRLLEQFGADLPDPSEWEYQTGRDARTWLADDVEVTPYDVVRRALATLDGRGEPTYALAGIARALDGPSEAVRRAVREEVADLLAPFDGTPVIAYAYDRKWGECSWAFLANSALTLADDQTLADMLSLGDFGPLIDLLARRGDVDIPDAVPQVADAGYLNVDLHPQQLSAWLIAHRPHLAHRASSV